MDNSITTGVTDCSNTDHKAPMNIRRDDSGFSMIELALYLGILTVLLLVAYSAYSSRAAQTQANRVASDITSIEGAVNNLYAFGSDFGTGSLTAAVANANGLPTGMWNGTTATNFLQGTVTITGNTGSFTIAYPGVPQEVCVIFLPRSQVGSSRVTSIQVGTGAVFTARPTEAQANAQCAAGDNTLNITASQ